MRALIAIIACFALSGCGAIQTVKVNEAQMSLSDAETACREQWPAVTRQTAIPRAACINDAEETTLLPVAGEFADLVTQRIAFRNALAAKIAKGDITPELAQFAFTKFDAALTRQAHARPVQTRQAQATVDAAFPNSAADNAAMMEATKATYTPAPGLE
jgi:hypothetical protein